MESPEISAGVRAVALTSLGFYIQAPTKVECDVMRYLHCGSLSWVCAVGRTVFNRREAVDRIFGRCQKRGFEDSTLQGYLTYQKMHPLRTLP